MCALCFGVIIWLVLYHNHNVSLFAPIAASFSNYQRISNLQHIFVNPSINFQIKKIVGSWALFCSFCLCRTESLGFGVLIEMIQIMSFYLCRLHDAFIIYSSQKYICHQGEDCYGTAVLSNLIHLMNKICLKQV